MKVSFQILTGRHKGKVLTLPAEVVTIGRDPEAHIRVNSTVVSRHHCEIHVRDQKVYLKDLGSRNGTFVNGEAIFGEVKLNPGDTLHVGAMIFQLAGKKKAPAQSPDFGKVPGARPGTPPASDDDVIDWLAEDEPPLDSDTTIVSNAEASRMGLDNDTDAGPNDSSVLVPRTGQINPKPAEDGTPAAEAAEVIKQYWSSKQ